MQQREIKMPHLPAADRFLALWALERAWQIFFLDHSIFIDDTNTFQLKFFI